MDTPETVHPSKPVERFGKEASEFTRRSLEGEDVYLVFSRSVTATKHRDRCGLMLADVWRVRDKSDFNVEFVREDFAFAHLKCPYKRGESSTSEFSPKSRQMT